MANINFQYEPLPVPDNWSDSERKLVTRLTDLFDIIFAWKGRLRVEDLAKSTAMSLITSASFVSSQVKDLNTVVARLIAEANVPAGQVSGFAAAVLDVLTSGTVDLAALTNLKAALDAAYALSTETVATLSASGWVGALAPYTQTVTVTGMKATLKGTVSVLANTATEVQALAASDARIRTAAQGENTVTYTAYGLKPAVDLPVTITWQGR